MFEFYPNAIDYLLYIFLGNNHLSESGTVASVVKNIVVSYVRNVINLTNTNAPCCFSL